MVEGARSPAEKSQAAFGRVREEEGEGQRAEGLVSERVASAPMLGGVLGLGGGQSVCSAGAHVIGDAGEVREGTGAGCADWIGGW